MAETETTISTNNYGLSRKTNIAMTVAGCFTAVGVATSSVYIEALAIICAFAVALTTILIQTKLDIMDRKGAPGQ